MGMGQSPDSEDYIYLLIYYAITFIYLQADTCYL